ncbi:MAG: right-handed parallel beta-helix repeat-containing protein, partial [Rubrivivax sp.]
MLVWLSVLLLAAVLLAGTGVWVAFGILGRTPVELIDYTKRRLDGHPSLELFSLPVLNRLRALLADQSEAEWALPFAVPALPPNPMQPAVGSAEDDPRVIRVGPTRAITRIAVAAQMAQDGSVIEIDPGDYVADVAVWERADLTIRGLGNRVRLVAGGTNAEGKGTWVFRSPRATVENIEFVNAKASDRNGAGIRLERGRLLVRRCSFWASQNGLMTSGEPDTQLEVEESEFGYNGGGDGITHGLYVGAIDSLRVRGSYFHHGNVGHLLKSRAKYNRIEYNRFTDEAGGRSSYEIEFPNGGVAEVVGNIVQQGSGARNSIIVSYGAEGYRWPRNELRFVHNTVVNDQRFGGSFLRVFPGAQVVMLRNNLLVGPGKVDGSSVLDAAGDRAAEWDELVRPAREDYRVSAAARTAWASQPLAPVDGALLPR